jgi:hypothetical protein
MRINYMKNKFYSYEYFFLLSLIIFALLSSLLFKINREPFSVKPLYHQYSRGFTNMSKPLIEGMHRYLPKWTRINI